MARIWIAIICLVLGFFIGAVCNELTHNKPSPNDPKKL